MKPDDKAPRSSTALLRVAKDIVTRTGGPVAGLVGTTMGVPYLGGGVALGLGTVLLGLDALRGLDSNRVRLALKRIFEDDDWTDYYKRRFCAHDGEAWKQRVLDCLDNLRRSVADEAVEPMIRLSQLVAKDAIDWLDARGLATALRQMTGEEIAGLRAGLRNALHVCDGAQSFDLFEVEEGPDTFVPHVATCPKRKVRLSPVEGALYEALCTLASTNVALRSPPPVIGNGVVEKSSHRFAFTTDQARQLLDLLAA